MDELSIWELFDSNMLTGLYRGTAAALRPNPLFDLYTSGPAANFEQDEVRVLTVGQVSEPAPLNEAGQPARVLDLSGIGETRLTAVRAFNTIPIHGRTLDLLRSFERGSRRNPSPAELSLQRESEGLLTREMRRLSARHTLTRQVYLAKTLSSGAIYVGGGGDILESATGHRIAISTGIPAAHMGSLPLGDGGEDLVTDLWNDADAGILDQLDAIGTDAEENGHLPPRHVWLHSARKADIRNNTQLKDRFGGDSGDFLRATAGESIEIGGYLFHFYGGTYVSTSGTRVPFIPRTKAIITPDPADGDWLVHGDGRTPVPTDLGIQGDLAAALANFEDRYGDFSYLATLHNVAALHVFVGFAWLFGLSAPRTIYVPTIAA